MEDSPQVIAGASLPALITKVRPLGVLAPAKRGDSLRNRSQRAAFMPAPACRLHLGSVLHFHWYFGAKLTCYRGLMSAEEIGGRGLDSHRPHAERLLSDLRRAIGQEHVLTDADVTESFSRDWTGRWKGQPLAVTRPSSTDQVSAVVRSCAAQKVPLVPQGGNTGLVGAGIPSDGEVVVSTRRLRHLGSVDVHARSVEVGAGMTLGEVQSYVRLAGLDLGIDFGARDSATIGGIVATNAGGERVMRHGTTRQQVIGLEAVLADGSVISRLSGLPKDNVGYDLVQLLVGSEGTLGVVTRAILRLVPYVRARATALVAVQTTSEALRALHALRTRLPALEAADYFHGDGLQLVLEHGKLAPPFHETYPLYLLVEVSGPSAMDDLVSALAEVDEVQDAVVAELYADRRRLWAFREGHTEAINAAGVPVKLDVAVPAARLEAFEASLPEAVRQAVGKVDIVLFGHLAEGNIHVNILGVPNPEDQEVVTDSVLRLVVSMGGSISAEHGVGRAKRRWLALARTPGDVAAMAAIKDALDPLGILSPGRVLPLHPKS